MKKPISSLDLNLLLTLQLLLQERSVTKAAKRMNVTPSAVSKSLAKLRDWFEDPLFVKTPLGLLPTPLTVSLEQDLADWMQIGNQILDKFHHDSPGGLTFEMAAETPLMLIPLQCSAGAGESTLPAGHGKDAAVGLRFAGCDYAWRGRPRLYRA
ncbi:putative LysR family transcriptional regulator [Enterobacter soli ATCC BAA-2102]|nr:putative LysR family transcriptional regulator [Enterobacter soli ATCC BAA-2102]